MPMIHNRRLGVPGNDSYTTVLLHMDGADASTTFTDDNAGGSAKTWTVAGNAQIDTAASKFGGAAGLFDGDGDYIYTADHADFQFGSGDFTIDFWFNRGGSFATRQWVFGQSNGAGNNYTMACTIKFETANQLIFEGYGGTNITSTTAFSAGGWHHVAIVRNGSTFTLYIDGVSEDTDTYASAVTHRSGVDWGIGTMGIYWNNSYHYHGWLDEFRVSKGFARWTANFTPPGGRYI